MMAPWFFEGAGWPSFTGSYPTGPGGAPAPETGNYDAGYTYQTGTPQGYTAPPLRGSVIPQARVDVPWAITFPRDPGTGAALPNAQDPILAGSRFDPYGFTVPQGANPAAGIALALRRWRNGVAYTYGKQSYLARLVRAGHRRRVGMGIG